LGDVALLQVFQGYQSFKQKYGDVSRLPTRHFLSAMKPGQEITLEVETGASGLCGVSVYALQRLGCDGADVPPMQARRCS
jgi:pyruvate carboxylase